MIAGRVHGSDSGTASAALALAAGQLDAVYTLEPTGTAGRLKGLTRVLENGVIAKYVLGDAHASLVAEVPLSGFTLHHEFRASDIGYFQKFIDVFTDRKTSAER